MKATHKLTFFYDCLSPFSCLAHAVIKRYANIWPVQLEYRPFLLGGVMANTKNLPPAARPWSEATRKIAAQDMQRNHGYFNCAMLNLPNNFFGPDGPSDKRGLARDMRYMRLLTAIRLEHPDSLLAATDHIFNIIHVGQEYRDANNNVLLTESLLESVCTSAGIATKDAHHLVHVRITENDVKKLLIDSVTEGIEKGSYGSPTIVISKLDNTIDEQSYFGADRFEQMAYTNQWPWVGPDPSRPTAKI